MSELINYSKKRLLDGGYTCVLYNGESEIVSSERGVSFLLGLYNSGKDYSGYVSADKVVGKGAALLYALLGIKEIYASVISESALSVLQKSGITCTYDTLVPHIINRRGDGVCPIERATMDIENPEDAPTTIIKTLEKLKKQ